MTNAERILLALDRHLHHEVSLVLYGRAAIVLGYSQAPGNMAHTLDVDVILRTAQRASIEQDDEFWTAQEAVNTELSGSGLYFTHLFMEDQVFLRRSWEQHIVAISRPITRWLRLSRPSTLDLVLTKMMRGGDPQDMEDAAFLIRHDRLSRSQLEATFAEAQIPNVPELQEAFEHAKIRVLAMVDS